MGDLLRRVVQIGGLGGHQSDGDQGNFAARISPLDTVTSGARIVAREIIAVGTIVALHDSAFGP